MLTKYRVTVREPADFVFDCEADDTEHAKEQAQNAYPDAIIAEVTAIAPLPNIQPDDEWFWMDPDRGYGSGFKIVSSMTPDGLVTFTDGTQAYAHELLSSPPKGLHKVYREFVDSPSQEYCGQATSPEEAAQCCADQFADDPADYVCALTPGNGRGPDTYQCRESKARPETVDLKLTISVSYLLNGTTEADMRRQLSQLVDHATNNGLLTGETDAEVTTYDYEIT